MIAIEKPDLDDAFYDVHPNGWRDVDYVIVGPIVLDNIENLGLTQTGLALENSEPVATFGEWSVNRVDTSAPMTEGD